MLHSKRQSIDIIGIQSCPALRCHGFKWNFGRFRIESAFTTNVNAPPLSVPGHGRQCTVYGGRDFVAGCRGRQTWARFSESAPREWTSDSGARARTGPGSWDWTWCRSASSGLRRTLRTDHKVPSPRRPYYNEVVSPHKLRTWRLSTLGPPTLRRLGHAEVEIWTFLTHRSNADRMSCLTSPTTRSGDVQVIGGHQRQRKV